MKETKGKGDPKIITGLIKRAIGVTDGTERTDIT